MGGYFWPYEGLDDDHTCNSRLDECAEMGEEGEEEKIRNDEL